MKDLDKAPGKSNIRLVKSMLSNVSEEYSGAGEEPPDSRRFSKNRLSTKEAVKASGYFSFVKNPSFIVEIVSDIEQCRLLWLQFSSQSNLFDTWEFRYAFYLGYKFKPYFIVLKSRTANLALLPLWFDEDKKQYTWFGSDWQEETSFFASDPSLVPVLLSLAPKPLFLNAISRESLGPLASDLPFEEDAPKYVLNLEGLESHEDFLMNLKKNRRRDLRKDRNRIERQGPEISIDNFDDIDDLIKVARERFSNKGEEADWEDARRVAVFKEVIRLKDRSYRARMITIKIKGRVAGVDLICLLKDTYYAVKCGYDVRRFSGIGNYMNLLEIDDAIKLRMKKLDLLQNNYEWKDRWFQAVPLMKYLKLADGAVSLRNFKPFDLDRILEIERSSFSEADVYSRERFESFCLEHNDGFLVAEKDSRVAGYLIGRESNGLGKIESMAVDGRYRRAGIGAVLIESIIDRFRKKGLDKACLEVRTDNENAVSFYRKCGFQTKEIIKGYYPDGKDAYLMEKVF